MRLLAQVLLCLAAVLLLCLFLKSFLIGPYYKKLHAESKDNKEILVLGTSAFVFFMLTVQTVTNSPLSLNPKVHRLGHHVRSVHGLLFLLQVTEFLDVSMELGCFLAGALLSTQGHMVTADVMGCVEPIRDFLAIIFFASIGQARCSNPWLLSAST